MTTTPTPASQPPASCLKCDGTGCDIFDLCNVCKGTGDLPSPASSDKDAEREIPDRMTERKTAEVTRTHGYQIVGYVMQKPGGDYCLSSQSAVRWLDQRQYWRLMHEQDGSLFAAKAQESAPSSDVVATWQERMKQFKKVDAITCAMLSEITDLRTALARRATAGTTAAQSFESINESVDFQAALVDLLVYVKNGGHISVQTEKIEALTTIIDQQRATAGNAAPTEGSQNEK